MNAVCPIQTCVCAAPYVVVGQRGATQVWDDVLDPAIHCGSDQINFMAVLWVAPRPAREDVGPHEDTLRENAPHGRQVLLDRGQQVSGAVSAQVVATQVYDEDVRVGPGDLQLVELGQELGPRHALSTLPPDGHLARVHAQLHTYLWRLGPWLSPEDQRMTTYPNVLGLTADWLAYKFSQNTFVSCNARRSFFNSFSKLSLTVHRALKMVSQRSVGLVCRLWPVLVVLFDQSNTFINVNYRNVKNGLSAPLLWTKHRDCGRR